MGNWGLIDEKLPQNSNYVEIYFGDTSYAYQTEYIEFYDHSYQVYNDSLFITDANRKDLVGKMEVKSDSVMVLHHPTCNMTWYRIPDDKGFKYQQSDDEAMVRAFLSGFYYRGELFKSK